MSNILRFTIIMLLAISLLFASVVFLVRISDGAPPPTEKQKVVGRRVFHRIYGKTPMFRSSGRCLFARSKKNVGALSAFAPRLKMLGRP